MENSLSDEYMLFLREHDGGAPEVIERPLGAFASYAEARRAQQEQLLVSGDSVIRYVGPAGGGD
jgi:hypothetical protein